MSYEILFIQGALEVTVNDHCYHGAVPNMVEDIRDLATNTTG